MAVELRVAPVQYFPTGAELTVLGCAAGQARASRLLALVKDGAVNVPRIDLAPGVYLAPTLGVHAIPADMTDDQLMKVGHLQQSIAVRHGLNMCVGGDIEVTEITAAGIMVRKIGEYPDKAKSAAQILALAQDMDQEAA